MKKTARKQQEAAQQLRKNAQMPGQQASRPASTADEINKLIEMFTQGDFTSQQNTPAPVTVENSYSDSIDSIESSVEEGGIEATAPTYMSIDQYVPYSSSIDVLTTEDNLHSTLAGKPVKEDVFNSKKNQPNPVLSHFELKKAVIYSAILEPKYF